MLCLKRKPSQSFELSVNGVRMRVVIRRIRGQWVSVAIDAPPEVRILRSELAVAQEARA